MLNTETIERLRNAPSWAGRETEDAFVEVLTSDRAAILAVLEAAQRWATACAWVNAGGALGAVVEMNESRHALLALIDLETK